MIRKPAYGVERAPCAFSNFLVLRTVVFLCQNLKKNSFKIKFIFLKRTFNFKPIHSSKETKINTPINNPVNTDEAPRVETKSSSRHQLDACEQTSFEIPDEKPAESVKEISNSLVSIQTKLAGLEDMCSHCMKGEMVLMLMDCGGDRDAVASAREKQILKTKQILDLQNSKIMLEERKISYKGSNVDHGRIDEEPVCVPPLVKSSVDAKKTAGADIASCQSDPTPDADTNVSLPRNSFCSEDKHLEKHGILEEELEIENENQQNTEIEAEAKVQKTNERPSVEVEELNGSSDSLLGSLSSTGLSPDTTALDSKGQDDAGRTGVGGAPAGLRLRGGEAQLLYSTRAQGKDYPFPCLILSSSTPKFQHKTF